MKKIIVLLCFIICMISIAFCAIPPEYNIANGDESGAVSKYYGYTKRSSDWWIISRSSTVASVSQWKYAVGNENYSTNWGNRATINYYDWADTYENPN